MSTYLVGDIQGCYDSFLALLKQIDFSPDNDCLWLTGDLVNRGPKSLEVLAWVYQHRASVVTVLGNHDIFLLALNGRVGRSFPGDTLQPLLDAPQCAVWCHWLRAQPLLHVGTVLNLKQNKDIEYLLVHAGIPPEWSIVDAKNAAKEAEQLLQGDHWQQLVQYHEPDIAGAHSALRTGVNKARATLQHVTRIRMVEENSDDNSVTHTPYNGIPDDAPTGYIPWYEHPRRKEDKQIILFGHWAALGFYQNSRVMGVDSGCVWGGDLTAVRLDDGKVFRQQYAEETPPVKIVRREN